MELLRKIKTMIRGTDQGPKDPDHEDQGAAPIKKEISDDPVRETAPDAGSKSRDSGAASDAHDSENGSPDIVAPESDNAVDTAEVADHVAPMAESENVLDAVDVADAAAPVPGSGTAVDSADKADQIPESDDHADPENDPEGTSDDKDYMSIAARDSIPHTVPSLDDILNDDELKYTPLYLVYRIDPHNIVPVRVKTAGFSNRVIHCLQSAGINNTVELLEENYGSIGSIRQFGIRCLQEVDSFARDDARLYAPKADSADAAAPVPESETAVDAADKADQQNTDRLYRLSAAGAAAKSDALPLAERFGLDPALYKNHAVADLGLSVRSFNALMNADLKEPKGIRTVEELLGLSVNDLKSIKNLGVKSVTEILGVVAELSETDDQVFASHIEDIKKDRNILPEEIRSFVSEHREEIIKGDFGFCDDTGLTGQEKEIIGRYKEAHEILDEKLIDTAANDPRGIPLVLGFIREQADIAYRQEFTGKMIREALAAIPPDRMDKNAAGFIAAYGEAQRELNEIVSKYGIIRLRDFSAARLTRDESSTALVFLRWCAFDLERDIRAVVSNTFKTTREREVVFSRAKGEKLNAIGDAIGLTRERIRQIIMKCSRQFDSALNNTGLILKISAVRDKDRVLAPSELRGYFKEYSEALLYLMRITDNRSYVYSKTLDVFIVGDEGLEERAVSFAGTLPDNFTADELEGFIRHGAEQYGLTGETVRKAVDREYDITGNYYHRSRLTLTAVCGLILKKYYPDGLWIYGEREIAGFRQHVRDEFGDMGMPESDRSLSMRISDAGILCGRGIYKAKEQSYIPGWLADSIAGYIDSSGQTVFLMNQIYSVFEEPLKAAGIGNKYYLQGVLHELFGDRWYFTRDYISKDPDLTSVYSEIVDFIAESAYPVTREEVKRAFPGVTDVVLNFAIEDREVLNLFGAYLHAKNLKLSEREIAGIDSILKDMLRENDGFIHCGELYEHISRYDPVMLNNNFIRSASSMYSLAKYLFGDEYVFSRPFIAVDESRLDVAKNALQYIITCSDVITVHEVREFAKKHHIVIYSMLELVNSCNDTHFFFDRNRIISIGLTGLTADIAGDIEKKILDELENGETMLIPQLKCVEKFPPISVPWNEWLIYSAILKWGTALEAGTTSGQLKRAVPVIAGKGQLDTGKYAGITPEQAGGAFTADATDDPDGIEQLVMDFSDEDWERIL